MRERRGATATADAEEETVRFVVPDLRRRRLAGFRRRVLRAVLVLLALGVLAGAGWLVLFSPHVTAREVAVSGAGTVGERRVERVAEVPEDTPLARVDLDAVRARVESLAAVRGVEVSRSWPHTVRITVTERTPVAVIDRGAGLQGLDTEGVLFGGYPARPDDLPLVRTQPDTSTEALVEGARVVSALPPSISRTVDVVEVGSVDEIQLVLGNGRRVLWGSAEDSEQKAEVLAVLLDRPGTRIDVSVPGRPTTR